MAESARGCGYRQWHGVYFMSGSFVQKCDRGLIEIKPCECCGETARFNRGLAKIKPMVLFGNHGKVTHVMDSDGTKGKDITTGCFDHKSCYVCYPPKHAFMDWVGQDNYTIESFTKEAYMQGISRRIPSDAIPTGFVVGESVVYLAMINIIEKTTAETVSHKGVKARKVKTDAIFMAYKPTRIEKLFHTEEFTKHNMKAHDPSNTLDAETVIMINRRDALNKLGDRATEEEAKEFRSLKRKISQGFCSACDLTEEMLRKNITVIFVDPTDERAHGKGKLTKEERKAKFQIDLPKKTESDIEVTTVEEIVEKASTDEDILKETVESKPEPEPKKKLNEFFERKPEASLKDSEPLKEKPDYQNLDDLEKDLEDNETLEELQEKANTLTQEEKDNGKYSEAWKYLDKKLSIAQGNAKHTFQGTPLKELSEEKREVAANLGYDHETKPVDNEVTKISQLPQPQHRQKSDGVYEFVDDDEITPIPSPTQSKRLQHTEDCAIYYEVDAKCNCQDKEPKTVKVKDPEDDFLSQEEEAMGSDEDYDENQIGGQ